MTGQNLWGAAKTVLRWKFIAVQSYFKKQEKHWIDNFTHKTTGKEQQQQQQQKKKNPPKLVEGKKS